jgi:outer membrane receptor for ferrienterochelin and colicin
MRARYVAPLALAVALICVRSARADARSDARGHFNRGMTAIAERRFAEGVAELERAYELLPHPNVLYNIGRAKVQAGDLRGGLAYLKRYRESNPVDREDVERTIADLELQIAKEDAAKPTPVTPKTSTPTTDPVAPIATNPMPELPAGADPKTNPNPVLPPLGSPSTPATGKAPAAAGLKTDAVFDETVVTATNKAQSPLEAPSSTSIITQQDIQLSGITKIPELLRRLAGVEIMEVTGGQSEVSLRGFNQRLSNKVLVLVDGRSVYADFIGATFWQALSIGVEDVRRIEVVRGPGSALYGGVAFNGVINILTKNHEDGKGGVVLGVGELGQTHASLWATGRDAGFAWRASAGYDYLPRWSREVPDKRSEVSLGARDQNASARTQRVDFRAFRELGADTTFHLGGGLATGSLETLGVGTLNDLVLPAFVSSDVTAQLKSKYGELRVFYNRFETETALNAASLGQSLLPTRADQNIVNIDGALRLSFNTGASVAHRLTAGGQYRYKNVDWTFLDRRRIENHASLFVQDDVHIGKRVALVFDYRLDYIPYLNNVVQSPRGALLIHPTNKSTIRVSVASAFRPPTFLESYLSIPFQLPQTGGAVLSEGIRSDDPGFRIKPEQTLTAEVGYLNQDNESFVLDTSLYYNRVSNIIQLADARPLALGDLSRAGKLDPETGLFPVYFGGYANQCQKYNVLGGEIGVRTFPVEGLDIYANYTLNLASVDTSGCPAAQATGAADERTSAHKFNAGVQVRTKVGLEASLDFHVVSRQLWSERVTDVNSQSITNASFGQAAYSLLNMRAGYKFFKDRAELSAQVFNLLDLAHREHPFGQLVRRRGMAFVSVRF